MPVWGNNTHHIWIPPPPHLWCSTQHQWKTKRTWFEGGLIVEEAEDERAEQIDQRLRQNRWKNRKNWRDRSRLGSGEWEGGMRQKEMRRNVEWLRRHELMSRLNWKNSYINVEIHETSDTASLGVIDYQEDEWGARRETTAWIKVTNVSPLSLCLIWPKQSDSLRLLFFNGDMRVKLIFSTVCCHDKPSCHNSSNPRFDLTV